MPNPSPKAVLFSLLLSTALWTAPPAFAVMHLNTDELLAKADLVVLGEVVSVEQDVQATHAQIRVLQAYKGPEAAGSLVTVETRGGKVYVDESEPNFMTMQINLLFLQKTDFGYVCLNQADGQKIVRNENLYPFHDNISYSIPLKEYLKALESAAKALHTGKAESAAK